MNIYVGNLAYEVSEEDLREEFSSFGEVQSVAIMKDRFSGKSRGFGFVEMSNNNEAQSAISSLSGKELKGRRLNVSEAKPRSERFERPGLGRGPRRDRPRYTR